MRPDSIRLAPWHQAAVYGATVALVVSGLVWVVLHYFAQQKGDFGPSSLLKNDMFRFD